MKHFKIKIENSKPDREQAILRVKKQLAIIESLIDPVMVPLQEELKGRLNYLTTEKEWLFNFIGGGWNSVYALDKEEAVEKAIRKYECSVCKVALNTFRISTEGDKQGLLSLFY